MRSCSFWALLILSCAASFSQSLQTITKSKTVLYPQDYAQGIPEYFIPESTVVRLSYVVESDFHFYVNRISFLASTNMLQITNLSQWNSEAYANFKADFKGRIYYANNQAPELAGPLYLKAIPPTFGGIATTNQHAFSIVVLSEGQVASQSNNLINNPNTAVVVPSNVQGDVDVILEQSQDGVTWTQCLPGTYNSSTVKRFFRLRAVEK